MQFYYFYISPSVFIIVVIIYNYVNGDKYPFVSLSIWIDVLVCQFFLLFFQFVVLFIINFINSVIT